MTPRRHLLERTTRPEADGMVPTPGKQAAARTLEGGERFAAYVAHELRTPLATQRALLELALADPNGDAASWREIGEDVLAACMQQQRLLEACLILARSQRGLQRREQVDLAAIADTVLRDHDPRSLTTVASFEPAPTIGAPDLLERLVDNLVSNAISHNHPGGRIEVATRSKSGRVVLSVANTGPRIPVGELQRLFQPFQRLDSQPRSSRDGVGLGLAIVRAVADVHDAAITVQTRQGGGLGIEVAFTALD